MRIGIDARLLGYRRGGIAQYTSQLLTSLAEIDSEDEFVILEGRKGSLPRPGPNFRHRTLLTPPHYRWEQLSLPLELWPLGLDLLHCPDFIPPFRRPCPAVITVHDLAFLRFPETMTSEGHRYYGQVKRAVESAQAIIAVSEATKADMVELLGADSARIRVIYEAPEARFRPLEDEEGVGHFRQGKGLPQDYILWVSTIEPRKNLGALLRALALLRDRGLARPLVAVGERGWLYGDTLRLVEELALDDLVGFYGPASLDELLYLYNGARLFAFPSLYEGFGLPPLEAMACGTPVVAANTSSLPEVLGEAALYVAPNDVEGLAKAIAQAWEDEALRLQMREKGLAQAARYSWRQAAVETLALYREVVEDSPRRAGR